MDEKKETNKLKCSIGIMAYNEGANIGHLLKALGKQKLSSAAIGEIIVIASGCTDNTEEIVREHMAVDERLRLIVQKSRQGKASAVNLFLREAKEELLVLQSADTIPKDDTIEHLILPFLDPSVGMTGGHPVPVNTKDTFIGYAVNFLWELHHLLSLYYPKMGEIIAFRNIFYKIPDDTSVDEASIEPIIKCQGFKIVYAPEAIIMNKGAETVSDFILSRKRIYTGHLNIKKKFGYEVSTMKMSRVIKILAKNPDILMSWKSIFIPAIAILEIYSRVLGMIDFYVYKREYAVWEIATTTKKLIEADE